MPIVFGSPEAMAILKEDKFQQRIENDDSVAGLVTQIDALNKSIEAAEKELEILLEERWQLRNKLAELKKKIN